MYANDLYQYMILPKIFDRPQYCIKLTSKLFRDITSKLYSTTIPETTKSNYEKSINGIYNNIKETFRNSLISKWVSTNEKMLKKLQDLRLVFSNNNNSLLTDDYLNNKYKSLNISLGNFQMNLFHAMVAQRKFYYGLQGEQFTEDIM